MALSREKKHSRDLKEELNDKEIIDVEQNVKKDDSKAEKNDDKNELQEILDNVQAEKEALMSKLELLQNEHEKIQSVTGKSLSEALIFASTNPQYDGRLFIELQVQYMKIPSSNLGKTCCVQILFLTYRTIFVHNMFSPGLSLEFSCIEPIIQ